MCLWAGTPSFLSFPSAWVEASLKQSNRSLRNHVGPPTRVPFVNMFQLWFCNRALILLFLFSVFLTGQLVSLLAALSSCRLAFPCNSYSHSEINHEHYNVFKFFLSFIYHFQTLSDSCPVTPVATPRRPLQRSFPFLFNPTFCWSCDAPFSCVCCWTASSGLSSRRPWVLRLLF